MKKIFLILFLCWCGAAGATTMCARNDIYIATLSQSRDGTSISTNGNNEWTVNFDYATSNKNRSNVVGLAACGDAVGTANTADGTVSVAITDTGVNCWCMMKLPVVSDWVYSGAYASDSVCASSCATACANNVKTSTAFRTAMFGAIW